MGIDSSSGSALVMPELKEFVAERLEKEARILKERRKGREERLLAKGIAPGSVPATSAGPTGMPAGVEKR